MLRALQRRLAPSGVLSWEPRAKASHVLDAAKMVSASELGIPWTSRLANIRRMQTEAESTSTVGHYDKLQTQQDNPKSFSKSVEMGSSIHENTIQHKAISNLKTSSRHDLALVFTCKVCETRSVRTVCRESYDSGVVVVRCGGCNNLHLIADRLGWFGEPGSVEDLLAARGEEVKKGSVDTLNLTLEDLAGSKLNRSSFESL